MRSHSKPSFLKALMACDLVKRGNSGIYQYPPQPSCLRDIVLGLPRDCFLVTFIGFDRSTHSLADAIDRRFLRVPTATNSRKIEN